MQPAVQTRPLTLKALYLHHEPSYMLREGRKYTKVTCDSEKPAFDTAAGIGFYASFAMKFFAAVKDINACACIFKDAVTHHPVRISPGRGREIGFLSNKSFSAAIQRLRPHNR